MGYVLIVDDDKNLAKTLADMVDLFDWPAQAVHTAKDAVLTLRKQRPALILLDLNIDGVNGLEVCRYIKQDPANKELPIVFITAEDDPTFVERAKQAGAVDYLVKPIDFDKLEKLIEGLPTP